ncbi:DUF6518 family protein [Citricoccus nitrophenolicus]|uniref:DUF6518 family protein n=1 Tax=Citricoccus nitrophenolicus TaxID=863575 RepID=A0ABV0ILL8_9MICC
MARGRRGRRGLAGRHITRALRARLGGLTFGILVGLAAAWLRARGLRTALATAALAGVGVGESVYGLTVVADSTSQVYWSAIGLGGVALLTVMLVRRIRGPVPVLCAVAGTVAVAAAFLVTYSWIGGAWGGI